MRQRLRSHLSYANVISTLALFLVLGGGTALASYIITSNSQVGPGTISGHKPPTNYHANIVGGSVNGQDVADNSLTGADIKESSLTGDAQSLNWSEPAQDKYTYTPHKVTSVGPFTIKAACIALGVAGVGLNIYVYGPAGGANSLWSETSNDSQDDGTHSRGLNFPAYTNTAIVVAGDSGANSYNRAAGTTVLTSGATLVQVDFDAVSDARTGNASCFIVGTAMRAT